MAPASQAKRISAPVFIACKVSDVALRSSAASGSKRPSAARSSIWPPAMPPRPDARASSRTSAMRTRGSAETSSRAMHVEGEGQQRVAGQDRGRLVERLVHGRLAAAQSRHCPSPAGRHAPANSSARIPARRRPAARGRAARRTVPRSRPPETAAAACRRRARHSASLRAGAPAAPFRRAAVCAVSSRSSSASVSAAVAVSRAEKVGSAISRMSRRSSDRATSASMRRSCENADAWVKLAGDLSPRLAAPRLSAYAFARCRVWRGRCGWRFTSC